jgi:hypothetical protein
MRRVMKQATSDGVLVGRMFVWWEVPGSNPVDSRLHFVYINVTNRWGTRGAHALGHVSPYYLSQKWTRVNIPLVHVNQ